MPFLRGQILTAAYEKKFPVFHLKKACSSYHALYRDRKSIEFLCLKHSLLHLDAISRIGKANRDARRYLYYSHYCCLDCRYCSRRARYLYLMDTQNAARKLTRGSLTLYLIKALLLLIRF